MTSPDPNPPRTPVDVPHPGRRRRGVLLVLIVIMLIGVNLRITITSLGALLDRVATDLNLSAPALAAVTALPTLTFAGVGALTGRLHRRTGPGPLLIAATALLALGQLARAATDSAAVFLVASAAALAGIAVCNILLPV